MPRRSAKDAAITRQRIMDEAQTLFAEKGFAHTSTAEIARAAKVTDGAVFHHFRDKKTLFAEIAEQLHRDLHKAIYKAGIGAETPMAAFVQGTRASMALTQTSPYRNIIFVEGPVILGTDKWREIDQELGLQLIEGGLRLIADAPGLPDAEVRAMAIVTLGAINEMTYAQIRKQKGLEIERGIELIVAALEGWVARDVAAWKRANPSTR